MRKIGNVLKKTVAAILAAVILVTAAGGTSTMTAQAAAPKIEKNLQFRLYKNYKWMPATLILNASGGKITKIKYSNPSVLEVSLINKKYLAFKLKSAGSTKVSFMYKGKRLTTKVTVKKWVNPCKEFKIGNKDYAKVFNKSERYYLNRQNKTINAKVKITPKKGWKLVKIVAQSADEIKEHKVKNNSKVRFSTHLTGTVIFANFKNLKTGEYEDVALWRSSSELKSENKYRLDMYKKDGKHSIWI